MISQPSQKKKRAADEIESILNDEDSEIDPVMTQEEIKLAAANVRKVMDKGCNQQ